jgi:hypothetical protein
MSIHRVRLKYSEVGAQSFNAWLTNMAPWAGRENPTPCEWEDTKEHGEVPL